MLLFERRCKNHTNVCMFVVFLTSNLPINSFSSATDARTIFNYNYFQLISMKVLIRLADFKCFFHKTFFAVGEPSTRKLTSAFVIIEKQNRWNDNDHEVYRLYYTVYTVHKINYYYIYNRTIEWLVTVDYTWSNVAWKFRCAAWMRLTLVNQCDQTVINIYPAKRTQTVSIYWVRLCANVINTQYLRSHWRNWNSCVQQQSFLNTLLFLLLF